MIVLRMLGVAVVALVTVLALLIQFEKIERAREVFQQHHSVTRDA